MASKSSSAKTSFPYEIISLILEYLPREHLSQARQINKDFAAVATFRLFETIPLWLGRNSLKALTELSQHSQLRHYVKEIVFSPLWFAEHKDESAHLSHVRNEIGIQTDSSTLSALQYMQYESAYRTFIDDQRKLTSDGLDKRILTHAFKQLSHLESIILDYNSSRIGTNLLHRELGTFDSGQLLTRDCLYPLPILIYALASAGVKLRSFTIGSKQSFSTAGSYGPLFPPRLERFNRRLYCSTAAVPKGLKKSFCDKKSSNWIFRAFCHLRAFEIHPISMEEDDNEANDHLVSAVKRILGLAHKLQTIRIGQLGSLDMSNSSDMAALFGENTGQSLRHLDLSDVQVSRHRLVQFLSTRAPTLEHIALRYMTLVDWIWASLLAELRAFNFPRLEMFELEECHETEWDIVVSGPVQDFVLRKTEQNPFISSSV